MSNLIPIVVLGFIILIINILKLRIVQFTIQNESLIIKRESCFGLRTLEENFDILKLNCTYIPKEYRNGKHIFRIKSLANAYVIANVVCYNNIFNIKLMMKMFEEIRNIQNKTLVS